MQIYDTSFQKAQLAQLFESGEISRDRFLVGLDMLNYVHKIEEMVRQIINKEV